MTKVKIGRNEQCNCGSGIKYKKCCEITSKDKYFNGQPISSEEIITCMEIFKIMYDKNTHKIIDITDDLSESTYKTYQIKNYYNKTIMLAKKTQNNQKVFETRVINDDSNIIVMYKGSYRTLPYEDIQDMIQSICDMIDESDNRE